MKRFGILENRPWIEDWRCFWAVVEGHVSAYRGRHTLGPPKSRVIRITPSFSTPQFRPLLQISQIPDIKCLKPLIVGFPDFSLQFLKLFTISLSHLTPTPESLIFNYGGLISTRCHDNHKNNLIARKDSEHLKICGNLLERTEYTLKIIKRSNSSVLV